MSLDLQIITRNSGVLLEGMATTLELTALALVLGLA